MALVLDTGVLFAAIHRDDVDHERCRALVRETSEERVIPAPVLGELDYWVRKELSPQTWLKFCRDVMAGAYRIHPVDGDLLVRVAELEMRYEDLRIGLVDAAVFATCERLGEDKVATLDRRHLSVLRTEDGRALEIVPT